MTERPVTGPALQNVPLRHTTAPKVFAAPYGSGPSRADFSEIEQRITDHSRYSYARDDN